MDTMTLNGKSLTRQQTRLAKELIVTCLENYVASLKTESRKFTLMFKDEELALATVLSQFTDLSAKEQLLIKQVRAQ